MTVKKRTVVVFAGGSTPRASVLEHLSEGAFVIAADSGFDHARKLGVSVDLLVGDLDSISSEGLAAAGEIERHPIDKDATDLELAMKAAARRQHERLIVVGGEGGRIDHFIANVCLIAAPEIWGMGEDVELTWLVAGAVIHIVRKSIDLAGAVGDIVSLLPLGGPASGVTTKGLRWELRGEVLVLGSTRGVSNNMVSDKASVELTHGTLLAVHLKGTSG